MNTEDYSQLDARIVEVMQPKPHRDPLVMVAEIADALGEPRRLIQMRCHTMANKGRIFRHELDGDITYHLELRTETPPAGFEPKRIESIDEEDGTVFSEIDRTDPSYAQLESLIIAAIDAKKRTMPQIRSHAGLSPGFDIAEVLTGMCMERKIRKENNGIVTAYFRYKDKPLKFWITGDSTVEAEFDENHVSRDAEQEKAKSMELAGRKAPDEYIDAAGRNKKSKQRVEIDEDALELAASTEIDDKAIAEALNISVSIMKSRMDESIVLRDAYKRGKEQNPHKTEPETVKSEPKPTITETKPVEIKPQEEKIMSETAPVSTRKIKLPDLQRIEDLAAEGNSVKTAAEILDIKHGTFSGYVKGQGKDQTVREAWKRGVARRPETDTSNKSGGKVRETVREPLESPGVDLASGDRVYGNGKTSFTAKDIERLAEKHGTKRLVAEALGYPKEQGLYAIMAKYPEVKTAFDAGFARFEGEVKRGGPPKPDRKATAVPPQGKITKIERFSPDPPVKSNIVMDLDETEAAQLDQAVAVIEAEHFDSLDRGRRESSVSNREAPKVIGLSNGATLVVGFGGNFFTASRSERGLLNEIADLIERHEETANA